MKEGPVMKGCIASAESLPNRPAPPAPNKRSKQVWDIYEDARIVAQRHRQNGFDAGIEAAANALETDAKKCDCFARNEGECGCGAWCEWKSITSARAIEIVRAIKDQSK